MNSTQRLFVSALAVFFFITVALVQPLMVHGEDAILFRDDFESVSEVAGAIGDPLDADPAAAIGSWVISETQSSVPAEYLNQVTDYAVPGPAQGNNYFRLQRPYTTNEISAAKANFTEMQEGGRINISYSMNIDMLEPFRTYAKLQSGDTQRCRYWVETKEDSTAEIWYGTADAEYSTGLSFLEDEWVQFDLNVNLNKSVYDLTLSGGSGVNGTVTDIPFYTPGNTADNLYFQIGRYTNCHYDDITVSSPPPLLSFPIGQSQLFVDDAMIASRSGLVRRTHAAEKLEQPVLEAETPWEVNDDGLDKRVYISGTVLYDETQAQYRMWYLARPDLVSTVAYATSPDGVNWTRPNLGRVTFEDSTDNNLLPLNLAASTVIVDKFETDDARRYKMLAYHSGKYYSAYSADGIDWTIFSDTLSGNDTGSMVQDPVTGEYLAFFKRSHEYLGETRRLVYMSTSPDMINWSPEVLVMAPDAIDDAQTQAEGGLYSQFYQMSTHDYGGQYLGFVAHLHYTGEPPESGPNQSQTDGPIDVQIVSSRDGRNWERCEDRSPVIANGPYDYDAGCILYSASNLLDVGDETWLYYTGITTTHGGYTPEKEITICRATWRREGFVSLDAGSSGGELTTVPFELSAGQLTINAVTGENGFVLAELLDEEGNVIPGYDYSTSSVFTGDSLAGSMMWSGCQIGYDLVGEIVQLRFILNEASLYSFRFSVPLTPGDANGDGLVDASDAALLADNWLKSDTDWAEGDFNGDRVVDDADAALLAVNWHCGVEVGVPEPGLVVTLIAFFLSVIIIWPRVSFADNR